MKRESRWLALALPLLLFVLLGTSLFLLEQQRRPDWQEILDEYLLAEAGAASVVASRPAAHPENLKEKMVAPVSTGWAWDIQRVPYPPRQLYCVLLTEQPSMAGQAADYRAVYVGWHSDGLWRTGWLVHEALASSTSPGEQFRQVDCELPELLQE